MKINWNLRSYHSRKGFVVSNSTCFISFPSTRTTVIYYIQELLPPSINSSLFFCHQALSQCRTPSMLRSELLIQMTTSIFNWIMKKSFWATFHPNFIFLISFFCSTIFLLYHWSLLITTVAFTTKWQLFTTIPLTDPEVEIFDGTNAKFFSWKNYIKCVFIEGTHTSTVFARIFVIAFVYNCNTAFVQENLSPFFLLPKNRQISRQLVYFHIIKKWIPKRKPKVSQHFNFHAKIYHQSHYLKLGSHPSVQVFIHIRKYIMLIRNINFFKWPYISFPGSVWKWASSRIERMTWVNVNRKDLELVLLIVVAI